MLLIIVECHLVFLMSDLDIFSGNQTTLVDQKAKRTVVLPNIFKVALRWELLFCYLATLA